MLSFSAHPAMISVTQGIQDAFRFLGASWRRWLPMVVVISACTLVIYAVVYSFIGSTDFRSLYYIDNYTGRLEWQPDAQSKVLSLVPPLIVLGLVFVVLNLVATWVFTATAVGGLRRQPMSASYVIERGVRVFVAGLILGVVAFGALLLLVIFTVVTMGIGFLLWFLAVPAAVYIALRLEFMSLAIFDGFGIIDGMKESWRLSQRSVLRIFGWGLMAGLITIAFSLLGGIVSVPFSASGAQPLSQAVSSGVSATASCFVIFVTAVLYESQRARMDPNLYGPLPMPVYGGYGYLAAPPAIPGWVDPNAPPAAYGYPTYPPQPPASYGYPPQPPAGYGYQGYQGYPGYPGYPQQPPAGPGWANPSAPPPPYGWVNPTSQPPAFSYPGQAQPGSGWVVPGQAPSAPIYPSAPQGWVAPPTAAPAPLAPPQSGPAAPTGPTEPAPPAQSPAPTDPPATE